MTVRFTASFLVSWLKAILQQRYEQMLRSQAFGAALDAEVKYFDEKGSETVRHSGSCPSSLLEVPPSVRTLSSSSSCGVGDSSVPDGSVATLLGKIKGGLDHWLTFVGEPAVSPANNAAESALRKPVVLRELIGTLRNDRGMFVHGTLLSLLAPGR